MSFSYSGSQLVSRGAPGLIFADETYYSFKVKEFCRIGVDGNPLIDFKADEEFIIKIGVTYIFDRDTKISLSYPLPTDELVVDPTQVKYDRSSRNFSLSAGLYYPCCTMIADRDLTAYDIFAFASIMIIANETGVITRLRYNGVTIASRSDTYSSAVIRNITLDVSSTVVIPKNGVITLEVEGSGSITYIRGDYDETLIRIIDTA